METTGIVIWIIVAAMFGLAVWGLVENSKNKEKKNDIKKAIKNEKFNPDSVLVKVPAKGNHLVGIAIDRSSNRLCLISGEDYRYLNCSELIESEVIIDGKTVTKTSRASQFAGAAVGAALLGGVGAVIGGLSGKTTTEQQAKGVKLKVVIDNIENPFHVIDFIELTNNGSTPPKIALKEANEWHELLSTVIKINERKSKEKEEKQPAALSSSMSDEIEKLNKLKISGVLSEEEFNSAKGRLIDSWS